MLNVRWQLLAELEALQKDALVARLQHSSLLQVLLCDVTANEAQIWGSLPPRDTPLGGNRAPTQVSGCPPRLHPVPVVGFCDPQGAVGILKGKGYAGAVGTSWGSWDTQGQQGPLRAMPTPTPGQHRTFGGPGALQGQRGPPGDVVIFSGQWGPSQAAPPQTSPEPKPSL